MKKAYPNGKGSKEVYEMMELEELESVEKCIKMKPSEGSTDKDSC